MAPSPPPPPYPATHRRSRGRHLFDSTRSLFRRRRHPSCSLFLFFFFFFSFSEGTIFVAICYEFSRVSAEFHFTDDDDAVGRPSTFNKSIQLPPPAFFFVLLRGMSVFLFFFLFFLSGTFILLCRLHFGHLVSRRPLGEFRSDFSGIIATRFNEAFPRQSRLKKAETVTFNLKRRISFLFGSSPRWQFVFLWLGRRKKKRDAVFVKETVSSSRRTLRLWIISTSQKKDLASFFFVFFLLELVASQWTRQKG